LTTAAAASTYLTISNAAATYVSTSTSSLSNYTTTSVLSANYALKTDIPNTSGFLTSTNYSSVVTTLTAGLTVTGNGTFSGVVYGNGSTSVHIGNYGFLIQTGTVDGRNDNTAGGTTNSYSVVAAAKMLATEFDAISDSRVKENIEELDPDDVIRKLCRLKPVKYTFVDRVNNGDASRYGFVAQDVEQVFPDAVTTHQDFVPNIYAHGTCVHLSRTATRISIDYSCEVAPGKLLRIIGDKSYDVEVIRSGKGFIDIDLVFEGRDVFVVGTQVEDFRSLTYNHIYTLSVKAIQVLVDRLEEKSKAMDALAARVAAIEMRL